MILYLVHTIASGNIKKCDKEGFFQRSVLDDSVVSGYFLIAKLAFQSLIVVDIDGVKEHGAMKYESM